jgi:hypothetical protein
LVGPPRHIPDPVLDAVVAATDVFALVPTLVLATLVFELEEATFDVEPAPIEVDVTAVFALPTVVVTTP